MLKMMRDGTKNYLTEVALIPRREEFRINAVWQIDVAEMPIYSINEYTATLIKPWIISAIDCFSRVVVLAKVCRSHPTSKDVLIALLEAILPKKDLLRFAYGLPSTLVPDNHSIFMGAEFTDAMLRAGVNVVPPPKESPQGKGKIERFFKTVTEQLCARLVGYTQQSVGLNKARQQALPFGCLQSLVDKFLLKYHSRTHSPGLLL